MKSKSYTLQYYPSSRRLRVTVPDGNTLHSMEVCYGATRLIPQCFGHVGGVRNSKESRKLRIGMSFFIYFLKLGDLDLSLQYFNLVCPVRQPSLEAAVMYLKSVPRWEDPWLVDNYDQDVVVNAIKKRLQGEL